MRLRIGTSLERLYWEGTRHDHRGRKFVALEQCVDEPATNLLNEFEGLRLRYHRRGATLLRFQKLRGLPQRFPVVMWRSVVLAKGTRIVGGGIGHRIWGGVLINSRCKGFAALPIVPLFYIQSLGPGKPALRVGPGQCVVI